MSWEFVEKTNDIAYVECLEEKETLINVSFS